MILINLLDMWIMQFYLCPTGGLCSGRALVC